MENIVNIEVGRGYIVTAYQYSDDADKYRMVIRHADGREICTMYEWCYGIEYHMGETSKIMKRIMYLLDRIEDEDGEIELLIEWVLSTMKYWGNEMYEVLYEEFKGIIEGIIGCSK